MRDHAFWLGVGWPIACTLCFVVGIYHEKWWPGPNVWPAGVGEVALIVIGGMIQSAPIWFMKRGKWRDRAEYLASVTSANAGHDRAYGRLTAQDFWAIVDHKVEAVIKTQEEKDDE